MVFKPWTDIKTPRHLVSDLDDFTPSSESSIPSVTIKFNDEKNCLSNKLLILPQSLNFIHEAYKNISKNNQPEKVIGVIQIRDQLSRETANNKDEEDYSIEEQLYDSHSSEIRSNINFDTKITQVQNISFIIVPNFNSPILFNLLAKCINENNQNIKEILTITPGENSHLINLTKLSNNKSSLYENIPTLTPPFYITGISASLLTQVVNVTALVLQSEGPQGYEKVNDDSIGEVSFPLAEFFEIDRKILLKSMRKEIGSTVNNFALYL